MAKKPVVHAEMLEVFYDDERWGMLKKYRNEALTIMDALDKAQVSAVVHGSIARGDVTEKSDVDVFVPNSVSSFSVEVAMEKASISVSKRLVVQATPVYAMKAYIEIDENTSVSFPLMKMRKVEREFYRFGGEATLDALRNNQRLLGVDKRLMLIEPTTEGHRESAIIGREEQVARLLGVSAETVLDRVRALLRRDSVGRTGVFVKEELSADETFEMALERIAKRNPAVRRRLVSLS